MEDEKKFTNEMFGYNKKEVDEYIKEIRSDFTTKFESEKSENNRLSNELTIVRKKLERYETDYIQRQEKVANALITAEDQSRQIIESARKEAEEERARIENLIEMEKEKLIDLKRDVIDLKEQTTRLLAKYNEDIEEIIMKS